MRLERLRVGLAHQVADPLRIDRLAGVERAMRAPAEITQKIGQLLADDALAEKLVGQLVVDQEVVVEEVAERAVADVVEEPGRPQQLLDQRRRRRVGEGRAERGIEVLREATGQVHRPQGGLEAAVLGGRVDPARRLELRHTAQSLHPRGVDQVLLARLAGNATRSRVKNVLMDGVGDEASSQIRIFGALHRGESTPGARSEPRVYRTGKRRWRSTDGTVMICTRLSRSMASSIRSPAYRDHSCSSNSSCEATATPLTLRMR